MDTIVTVALLESGPAEIEWRDTEPAEQEGMPPVTIAIRRMALSPGQALPEGLPGDIVASIEAHWTPELVAAYLADQAAQEPEPPRRMVPKSTIIARLTDQQLAAASQALASSIRLRERWYSPDKPAVYADDPDALALLAAIGADPDVIMAP